MLIIGITGKKGSGKSTLADAIVKYCTTKNFRSAELSFASALKSICVDIFNINIQNFIDPELKNIKIDKKYFEKPTSRQKKIKVISSKFGYSSLKSNQILLSIFESLKLIKKNCTNLPNAGIVHALINLNNITPREIMQVVGVIFPSSGNKNVWIDIINEKLATMEKYDAVIISDVRFVNELTSILSKKKRCLIKINRPSLQRNSESDNHISETELDDFESFFDHIIFNTHESPFSFQEHAMSTILPSLVI